MDYRLCKYCNGPILDPTNELVVVFGELAWHSRCEPERVIAMDRLSDEQLRCYTDRRCILTDDEPIAVDMQSMARELIERRKTSADLVEVVKRLVIVEPGTPEVRHVLRDLVSVVVKEENVTTVTISMPLTHPNWFVSP